MKKYNSVITLTVSIDHDHKTATDLTDEAVLKAIKLKCDHIRDGGWQPWVDLTDTIPNQ